MRLLFIYFFAKEEQGCTNRNLPPNGWQDATPLKVYKTGPHVGEPPQPQSSLVPWRLRGDVQPFTCTNDAPTRRQARHESTTAR